MPQPSKLILLAGATAWIVTIIIGFGALQRYASTAGDRRAPVSHLDQLIEQHRQPGRGLVVMAVHPRCPCTDASLAELGDLLARSKGDCTAILLEYQPATQPPDWPDSPASRMLGGVRVPVVADSGGKLAALTGALTSGHLVFADRTGVVRFHGGITLTRGHRGRAPAQDAILAVLEGKPPSANATPVYGCALLPECKTESAQ